MAGGSLLAEFFIRFTSDATGVAKGAKEAKVATDSVNNSLLSTNQLAAKAGNSFMNLAKQYGGFIAASLSVGALVKGINNAANFADHLDELSKAINVNVEDLSVWGDAVKIAGGTAESFQETTKHMAAELANFATKGTSRAAPFFRSLGIAMVDSAGKARNFFELLPELADAFQKLGKEESFGIGRKMGLDDGTIMLMQKGRVEVDAIIKRQKELGVVTKEDAEIAAKFNDQWDDMQHAFRSVFTAVGSAVLPAFTAILNIVERVALFMKKHSSFMTGIFVALGVAILTFVVPPLLSAAAAALVLYAPFLLIGAAVAALIVGFGFLWDELSNFFEGNDSYIGDLVKKWPKLGFAIFAIRDAVKGLGATFKAVFAFIKDGAQSVLDFFDKILGVYEKVKGALGFGGGSASTGSAGQAALASASGNPFGALTSQSIANSTQNQSSSNSLSIGQVAVNTQATDANGIGAALGPALQTHMRQAVNSFDDGIRA